MNLKFWTNKQNNRALSVFRKNVFVVSVIEGKYCAAVIREGNNENDREILGFEKSMQAAQKRINNSLSRF